MQEVTNFFDTALGKTVKAAAYVAVSAVLSYLIAASTSNPSLFGPLTVVINAALVAVKNVADPKVPNLPQ